MLGCLVLASVISLGLCAGGWHPASKNDYATYEALLTGLHSNGELLTGYECQTDSIETQVVAGVNIRYHKTCANGQTCTVTVWQKTWENFLKVTDNTCTGTKRQIPGGFNEVTDQVQVDEYMGLLNQLQSSNQLDYTGYTVQHIYTQVVSGLNIKFMMSKGGSTCEIMIYSQSWTNTLKVTHNTCKGKRQLLGGYQPVDASNPDIQKCLTMSLDRINGMSNSMFRLVESGVKAEQQVVAGMNYALTFKTVPSTCMNSGSMYGKTSADCPMDTNSVMTQNTWSVRCYKDLSANMSVTDVQMMH